MIRYYTRVASRKNKNERTNSRLILRSHTTSEKNYRVSQPCYWKSSYLYSVEGRKFAPLPRRGNGSCTWLRKDTSVAFRCILFSMIALGIKDVSFEVSVKHVKQSYRWSMDFRSSRRKLREKSMKVWREKQQKLYTIPRHQRASRHLCSLTFDIGERGTALVENNASINDQGLTSHEIWIWTCQVAHGLGHILGNTCPAQSC